MKFPHKFNSSNEDNKIGDGQDTDKALSTLRSVEQREDLMKKNNPDIQNILNDDIKVHDEDENDQKE